MGVSESEDEPMGEEPFDNEGQDIMANEDGSVEDTEEEEEDVAMYENDGFVVDEAEGEAESDSDVSKDSKRERREKKKRKKRRAKDDQLDDEDFSWLDENNAGPSRGRGPRRLVKGGSGSAMRLGGSQSGKTPTAFPELEDFPDDDEGPSYHPEAMDDEGLRSFSHRDDEMELEDFIVDEAADERSSQQKRHPRDPAVSAAMQEALKEGEDPAAGSSFKWPAYVQKALQDYDPEALAMHCLLPQDDAIRQKDVPERFQERMGVAPTVFEYELAAEWIYSCLFGLDVASRESEIVENGQLEIDGPSLEDDYSSKNPEFPCKGHRVVHPVRLNDQKEKWKQDSKAQAGLKKSIENVLKHIYEDLEEIPYIATYRKQSCGELLALAADEIPNWTTIDEYNGHKDENTFFPPPGAVQAKSMKMKRWQVLWTVFELSLKWRRLRTRIEKRVEIFTDAETSHLDDLDLIYGIHKCIDCMQEAVTPEDADLADRRFRLLLTAMKKQPPESGISVSSDVQKYAAYCEMGCHSIVEGMGIRDSLCLELHGRIATETAALPVCCTTNLHDLVADIMKKNKGAVGVDAVLNGARHVAAMDLASHSYIRTAVKRLYEQHAVVTTTPTELGEKVLDPFHVYGYIKRLVEKPIDTFKGDTFLRIIGASRSGYVNFTLEIKDTALKCQVLPVLMAEVMETDSVPLREGWEDLRKNVIEQLAKGYLFPSIEKEMIQKLSERARNAVLSQMSETLWKFVIQGPFKPATDENNFEEGDTMVRVCACCWGQGGKGMPSTVLVMLDSFGELKDMIELKQFSGFFDPPPNQDPFYEQPDVLKDERKKEDAQRIRQFLMEHKPHVVVVGGAHMVCKKLVEDLTMIREHFLTEHSRFMVSIQGSMEFLLLSEMIPAIWENSPAAKRELPDHSAHVRRAVALGRCLIDPLSVVASMRDHSDTILSVALNDLQGLIIKEEKLARLDEVMVTATNQLGGELNLMANIQWRSHALQFIAGLGRRKAQGVLRLMQRNLNRMECRADLTNHEQIGPIVGKNCIGFLIVAESELPGMANIEFDPLDETRIHVDNYALAKEMAMMAVETQDPEAALVELSERPYAVRKIDLDWFNNEGMKQGREDLISVLIDISMELQFPFGDRRAAFAKPTELEIFYTLLNEKADTMKPGKMVEAVVQSVDENEIRCSLVQSQLSGTIKRDQFSSTEDVQQIDLKSRVRRGDILTARLVGIEYRDFSVELSCRSSDLRNDEIWEKEYCTDPHYYIKTAEEKEQERASKEAKEKKPSKTRIIDHPLFKNVSQGQCIDLLSRSPPGYTILRPSTSGHQYITLSFNAFSGKHGDIYLHRDMKEGPKGARGAAMKLSVPLTMMLTSSRYMTFDDLDEVVPLFVDRYIERVKALKMHRKFRDGYISEVEQLVQQEKRRVGPSQAVYYLGVDYNQPGGYYIASILNVSVRREYFMIVPDGYYFRKQTFKGLEPMIDEFKHHPQPPQPLPIQRSPAPTRAAQSSTGWGPPASGPAPPAADSSDSDDDMRFG